MASTLINLAIMTPSSAFGTSATIPLGSAAILNSVTYLSFSAAGATGGIQVSYSLQDPVNGGSEIGTATYTSSNATLTNRTPTKSTAGSSYINASSGTLITGVVRGEDLNSFIVAGQLLGTSTNDSAAAGNVGQEIATGVVNSSGLTSAAATTITSLTLTPGDWDLFGAAYFSGSGTNIVSDIFLSVSTSSNSIAAGFDGILHHNRVAATSDYQANLTAGPARVSVNTNTTYYVNVRADLTGSSVPYIANVYGRARRMR